MRTAVNEPNQWRAEGSEPYATHTPNVISGHYRPPEVLLGCRDYGQLPISGRLGVFW